MLGENQCESDLVQLGYYDETFRSMFRDNFNLAQWL